MKGRRRRAHHAAVGGGPRASSAARPLKGERAAVDSCLRRGAMIAERARLTTAARIT
jgi:hypothetical protein